MQTKISRLSKDESRVSYGSSNLSQGTWTIINPALNNGVVIPQLNRWNLTISLYFPFFFIQTKARKYMRLGLHAQKNQGGQVGRTAPNYPKQLQTSYISQCVHKTCTLCLTTLYTKEYTTYSSLTCFLVLLMLEVDRS